MKHTPATPLPWRQVSERSNYEAERSGEYDAMPEPSRDAAELLLRDLGEL